MDPIKQGMRGPAVDDVQTRLSSLGFAIDETELASSTFGESTGRAVSAFRSAHGLPEGLEVDSLCWSTLVDASYKLGDRTLYLRLPNFHGADVRALQQALNTLGFACGADDGYFGPHTEAALQQFQENVGLFADGMAFQDTFSYINRLHHVWKDKPSVADVEAEARTGFARAAHVLENIRLAVGGEDAIARNVASRMWNIASATTEGSGIVLIDTEAPDDIDVVFMLASDELPLDAEPQATIALSECQNLAQRIKTAIAAAKQRPAHVRLELTGLSRYGAFTSSDAQTLAVRLLDGVCDALSDEVR
ncbi:MAG: peptidoglycan-binding protein [Collinsella sp.]|nr:peptidoglycan-binding protein [Collinsella sp.]